MCWRDYYSVATMWCQWILLLGSVCSIFCGPEVMFDSTHFQNKVLEGRKHYDIIKANADMPRYGECWTKALQSLSEGCKQLSEKSQAQLALSFTNCFLEMNGMQRLDCSGKQDCLQKADIKEYTTYGNFFTNTQSMCFFLQSQMWYEKTEDTVTKLAYHSEQAKDVLEHVSSQLQDTSAVQDKLLEAQGQALVYQKQLLENSSSLGVVLNSSRKVVENILVEMDEFRHSTQQQQALIIEVFDRLGNLQHILLGEVSWIYTVGFYLSSLFVGYLCTCTPQTSAARLYLILLLTCNTVVERCIFEKTVVQDETGKMADDIQVLLSNRIWLCRKTVGAIAVVILMWSVIRFRDYNIVNNRLLVEIQKQNQDLKQYLQNIGSPVHNGRPMKENPIENIYDESDSDSVDSGHSDHTYKLDSDSDSSVDETIKSKPTSPNFDVPPVNGTTNQALHKYSMTFESHGNPNADHTGIVRVADTPIVGHRYNLRQRTNFGLSPQMIMETDNEFAETVKKTARISRINGMKWIQELAQSRCNTLLDYSSGDD